MRTNQPEHIETVIIGAGQAGLATGYQLQRRGRPFVILDSESRVGDGWRHQWDSLRLFTPAWANALPGKPFPAPAWSYPTKEEFADYLESYAAELALPVRLVTRVARLQAAGAADVSEDGATGGYVVTTDGGQIHADNVVVATGTFGRTAAVPDFADQLDPAIVQLHSSEYRRPGQLPPGPVLVVGASHSGCDIAYELAATHATILAGRDLGQIPVPFDSRRFRLVFPVVLFAFAHVLTRRTPIGRKEMDEIRFHGGFRLRVQTKDLEERGVDWVKDRVTGVEDGRPVVEGRGPVDVSTVIWCTGFRQTFGWIDLDVFDDRGWPHELGGVVDAAPGLYFMGLGFQSSARSMMIHGAGPDSAHVVRHILNRRQDPTEYRRETEQAWASTSWKPDGRVTRAGSGKRHASI
jgi:putative flavoprotein involved in K+ transport